MTEGSIIRSGYDLQLQEYLIRNRTAAGAATAPNSNGPVIVAECHTGTLDATNTWVITNGATGASTNTNGNIQMDCPAGSDSTKVSSLKAVPNPYGAYNTLADTIWDALVVEFVLSNTVSLTNLDNTVTFFGLSSTQSATRATNSVWGFCFASDALNTLSDNAGSETVTPVSGAGTTYLKCKIIVVPDTVSTNVVSYYLNEVLVKQETAKLFTASPLYLCFATAAEAGGATRMLVKGPLMYMTRRVG